MRIDQDYRHAADLHWLAFLLTGDRERSIELAAEGAVAPEGEAGYFGRWMRAWSRRVVIAKALHATRLRQRN